MRFGVDLEPAKHSTQFTASSLKPCVAMIERNENESAHKLYRVPVQKLQLSI